jgi:DNA-binding transcriptional LysR family regulator
MNDLQIMYFLATARNQSFSKAARELYISQPAVSRQILALEKELGVTLFAREARQVKLTDSGRMFYDFFEKYRADLMDLKMRARICEQSEKRLLRFGIIKNWDLSRLVVPLLRRFTRIHPEVQVEIDSYEPHQVQELLQYGKEDVILTIEADTAGDCMIRDQIIARLPRVLLYNELTRPDTEGIPRPEDFKESIFLVSASGDYDYVADTVRSICKPYGFTPMLHPVTSVDAMIVGVQCGMGVALVDSWNRALSDGAFSSIQLNTSHELHLLYRADPTDPVIEDFIREIKTLV